MNAALERNRQDFQSSIDSAVTYTLGEVIERWRGLGFCIDQIPLGGTIAMQRGKGGELIAGGEGCFGSNDLSVFNERVIYYKGRPSFEPLNTSKSKYAATMAEAGYPANLNILYARPKTITERLPNNHVITFPMVKRQFPPGEYKLGQLLNDSTAVPFYTDFLSREITSGKYPNGVRLDSTQLYEKSAVFAVVACSYIMPRISRILYEYSAKMTVPLDKAMREAIFVVPVGTDRQVEVANFLDLISFYTGITFITVGANSPFEDPEALANGIKLDAKTNLESVDKVIEAIRSWRLSPGMTYSISDGLVMRNLVQKMRPDARGLLDPVRGKDGRYYGATFDAYFAVPVDKLPKFKSHSAYVKPKYDAGMLWSLTPFEADPHPPAPDEFWAEMSEEEADFFRDAWGESGRNKMWRENAARKSARFAEALEAIKRTDATDRQELLPLGTRAWIVEGAGDGNGPAQAVESIWYKTSEQRARSGGALRPLIIVSSECGFPHVGDDYAAGLYGALNQRGLNVVKGGSVPPKTLELLSAMLIHRKIGANVSYLNDEGKSRVQIPPYEMEKVLDFYGGSRMLPGFTESKARI